MANKKPKLVNILQLCMAGTMIIHLVLLGILSDIGLAIFWIAPIYLICMILITLSAFHISLFKKKNNNTVVKVVKFISIILLLLVSWGFSWIVEGLSYAPQSYYTVNFIHISFAIMVVFSMIIFSVELISEKKLQGEKNE